MFVAVRALAVLGVLYVAGRIMYQGGSPKVRWRMLHVVLEFCVVMVGNAVVMAALLAAFGLLGGVLSPLGPAWEVLLDERGRVSGGTLMLLIFLLVFVTAFVQYGLRRALGRRLGWVPMGTDEYQIFEYFIQWITIFCVVYQCFFEGFADLAQWAATDDIRQVFEIALSPANINLVLQPLLISSWITVVLERFARQNAPKRGRARMGRGPRGGRTNKAGAPEGTPASKDPGDEG